MNHTQELAIKEFKRNKELKAVHIVMNHTFSDLARATRYKKSIYAKAVTSILRTECAKELGEDGEAPVADKPKQSKPRGKKTEEKIIEET